MASVVHFSSVHGAHDTRILLKECASLAKAGHRVHLVVPHDKDEVVHDVMIVALPKNRSKSRLVRMTRTVWRVYRSVLAIDADIYHFHDPELLMVGLVLRKIHGKTCIYDIHEDYPKTIRDKVWIPLVLRKSLAYIFEKFENFAAARMNCCVTATHHIAERFLSVNNNTVGIFNYPRMEEFQQITSLEHPKKRQVCYVGGISSVRGTVEMVQAMGEIEGCTLVMAGTFPPGALMEACSRLPGWSMVQVLGHISRERVAHVCAESLAGLVVLSPTGNHINSEPIKMFEYMAAGLPVIMSHFTLWRKILDPYHCALCVDPLNPTAIAQAINWILDHPEESAEMGQRGKGAVEKFFNWELEGDKLIALYQGLTKSRKNDI